MRPNSRVGVQFEKSTENLNMDTLNSQQNEQDSAESDKNKSNLKEIIKRQLGENVLLLATILAVVLGIGLGFILRSVTQFNDNQIAYFGFVGQLFLRMLRFLILPLIASSLISGIAGLGSNSAGKIAARALTYYFSTTIIAVVTGIVLVVIIGPGYGKDASSDGESMSLPVDTNKIVTTHDTILDLIRNLFPDNIVEIAFREYETVLVPKYKWFIMTNTSNYTVSKLPANFENITNGTAIQILDYYKATAGGRRSLNVLGLILFCFVFGGVLASMGKEAELLIKLFEGLNTASVKMIKLVMLVSPFGIFSLIIATVLEMKNPQEVFARVSLYMVTVILGLFIHGVIVLPGLFLLITRKNILTYTRNMLDSLLIAVATASSTAALPTTFRCIEEKNKINKLISRFVLPVGATVNMDGTALYEAVAVIFIAQLNGRNLSFVDLVVTSLTATLASIGAASVPSAGLVTMVIVLSALNLPTNQISLIYTVDWFIDRLRTSINVWGDSIGAGIVDHLSKKEIQELEEQQRIQKEKEAYEIIPNNSDRTEINKLKDEDITV